MRAEYDRVCRFGSCSVSIPPLRGLGGGGGKSFSFSELSPTDVTVLVVKAGLL